MFEQAEIYPDAEAVARVAADYVSARLTACVNAKGSCHVALPGGNTPGRCLELLSREDLSWDSIHWYLGDERCYPQGHPERNDSMIQQRFWSRIEAPRENLHAIPAELGPETAAEEYCGIIMAVGKLDIIILGMGEDGHTASLFPGNAALQDKRAVVPVYNAPKPPDKRVSLGLTTLQAAAQRVVLVTGTNKHQALMRIAGGEQLPVSQVGACRWFIDEAAANHPDRISVEGER